MNFLATIRRHKEEEVALLEDIPLPEKSRRNFRDALSARTPCLIAEVKPMSPSKGKLIDQEDIETIVQLYDKRADAISVVCDQRFFGGSYDLLRSIRRQTDRPILAKEFIIDAKQILLARDAGADAILLIARLLTPGQAEEFSALADMLGMAVLYEIHTDDDMKAIPALGARQMIIGINNRDLATLTIDTQTTLNLAPIIRQEFPDHLIISESGICSIDDARKLQTVADGFLIGSGILSSENPAALLRSLSLLSPP